MAMGNPHGHFFWRTKRWPEQGPPTGINNGLAVAGWIHSALAAGEASAGSIGGTKPSTKTTMKAWC
jgi:hypothetical protein